jgi:ligand-binding sensor domain-containing protein/signal transduction histidine kinase
MKKPVTALAIMITAVACGASALRTSGATPPHLAKSVPSNELRNRPPEPHFAEQTVHFPLIEGERLSVRRLSTADGLSQSRVAQIVQDRRGFIWFGTQYGLNRFDGNEFKVFVHEPGQDNSLSCVYVFSLFEDRDGIIWIGCSQFLDRFDPRTETFKHYRLGTGEPDNLGGTVFHISQDHTGKLWLATGEGLYSLDPITEERAHYRHQTEDVAGLSTNDIKWTGEDRAGNLWVGTADGLDEFNPAYGAVRLHIPVPDAIRVSFFEDRDGRFWITRASGRGLALYDRASNTVTPYSLYEHDPAGDSLSGVNEMVEDAQGDLWIASTGSGLLQFDRRQNRFIHFMERPLDLQSRAQDRVNTVFSDRDGHIWVGLDAGANVFSTNRSKFQSFKHEANDPNSLIEDMVSAIYDDSKGSLWIGSEKGLSQIDRESGRRVLRSIGDLGLTPMIDAMTEDSTGVLWLGTFSHGLVSYDPRTQRYRNYRHDPTDINSLSSDQVHVLFFDHSGALWIGTDDGLDRFDPRTQQFQVYKVESESSSSQRYISIAEDASGILWLGTHDSGLHRFDPSSGRFTVYKPDPTNPASLQDAMTPSVHVSNSGIVWIGTQNGLNKFDPSLKTFSAFDIGKGLPANMIDCILEDNHGNLWLSTNKGLSRFNPTSETFANYSVMDGLPGNDLTAWSACQKNRRGELFFGGFDGAVAFSPDNLTDTSYVPALLLTDFQISGSSVRVGPKSVLKQSIGYTDSVTLSHEQNQFAVKFAAFQYLMPESTRYRYRLQGLSQNWFEVDNNSRWAAFTTLPAGHYTFWVQSKGSRGLWNEPGTALQILVLPPWWATWWFRSMYALAILLVAWCAYRWRIRQISRQLSVRMEERVNERTRIAQDLHDTLLQGLLGASMQLGVANGRLPGDSPAKPLVQRVVELLRLMIDESRNTVQGLRFRRLESDDLEKAISLIPEDLSIDSDIQFRVFLEGTRRHLRASIRDEVYWIARESISNAFRHSHSSLIETVIEYSKDRFRVVVRDDGCGMDPTTSRSGGERHWGLTGIYERSRKIGAELNISSAIGAGTEIELIVGGKAAFDDR